MRRAGPYLVVTSNGGKRTERVAVTKHNDSYIAKRESEPALYELSSSAVTDLQSAAKSQTSASTSASRSEKVDPFQTWENG